MSLLHVKSLIALDNESLSEKLSLGPAIMCSKQVQRPHGFRQKPSEFGQGPLLCGRVSGWQEPQADEGGSSQVLPCTDENRRQ